MLECVILKREELYEKVWSEPMSSLAPKYSLTDNGLKKICRKLEIPVPPRGYWARRQHGYKDKKAKLPKLKYGDPVGMDTLSKVSSRIRIPVFAIGGIKSDRIKEAREAGASGVAMISEIFGAEDIKGKTEEINQILRTDQGENK